MMLNRISQSLVQVGAVAAIASVSIAGAGALAPAASAFSLVPQTEGEVNVGLGASFNPTGYLTLDPIIASIVSEVDSSTGTRSRLFVDRAGTSNQYGAIKFRANDIGTAEGSGDYWFRPVAMTANGLNLLEDGQLEVGTFLVTFTDTLKSLTVEWFDTESAGTSYEAFSGSTLIASGTVTPGRNNNIFSTTFENVSSIRLNLGQKGAPQFRNTGDGVNFQASGEVAESVPEPGITLGLGAAALASAMGLRKNRKLA